LDSPEHRRVPQHPTIVHPPIPFNLATSHLQPPVEGDDPFALPVHSSSAARDNLAALRAAADASNALLLSTRARARARSYINPTSPVSTSTTIMGAVAEPSRTGYQALPPPPDIHQYQNLPAHLQAALTDLNAQQRNPAAQQRQFMLYSNVAAGPSSINAEPVNAAIVQSSDIVLSTHQRGRFVMYENPAAVSLNQSNHAPQSVHALPLPDQYQNLPQNLHEGLAAVNVQQNEVMLIHQPIPPPPPPPPLDLPVARRSFNKNNIPVHNMGQMNLVCPYCKAYHWKAEKLTRSTLAHPKFGDCCFSGKVIQGQLHDLPQEIQTLYNSQDTIAKKFRKDIRHYNKALSMTSVGQAPGKQPDIDYAINNGTGL
jgi:hypothetical protein